MIHADSASRLWPTPRQTVATTLYFMLLYTALHCIALYLFASGFFLTRYELLTRSECGELPDGFQSSMLPSYQQPANGDCWAPRLFDRAIIIIIDALRFDFAYPRSVNTTHPHLDVIQELLITNSTNCLLYKFVADAPTVTMQRLKGLTTGGLPTFFEVSENFESSAIREDTWVEQLVRHGRTLAFMGDDTWVKLFPAHFNVTWAFPSFNVKDLDTVDRGVAAHLAKAIEEGWSVVVAHLLGVDHVGHRYHSTHQTMHHKLREIDELLRRAIEAVGPNELLVVLGDHGMTADGNHGGASSDELGSALFMYSRRPLMYRSANEPRRIHEAAQIDLVPTLALALGVPIPYGNLGGLIPEVFTGHDRDELQAEGQLEGAADGLAGLHYRMLLNCWQVYRYLAAYSAVSPEFPLARLAAFRQSLDDRTAAWPLRPRGPARRVAAFHLAEYTALRSLLDDAVAMCRARWATFDLPAMVWGMVLAVATSLLMAAYLVRPAPSFPLMPVCVAAITGVVLSLVVLSLRGVPWVGFVVPQLSPVGPCAALVVGTLLVLVVRRHGGGRLAGRWATAGGFLVAVLYGAGLFSNSYIESDEDVVLFLGCTAIAVHGLTTASPLAWRHVVAMLVLMRLTRAYSAFNTAHPTALTALGPLPTAVFAGAVLSAMVATLWRWADRIVADMGDAQPVWLSPWKLMVATAMGLVGGHWVGDEVFAGGLPYVVRVAVPRAVYVLSLVMAGVLAGAVWLANGKSSHVVHRVRLGTVALLGAVLPPLAMLLGPKAAAPLAGWLVLLRLLAASPASALFWRAVVWAVFAAHQHFFATGHRYDFASLNIHAGFVGVEDYDLVWNSVLILLNTFAVPILTSLSLPLVACSIADWDSDKCSHQPFSQPGSTNCAEAVTAAGPPRAPSHTSAVREPALLAAIQHTLTSAQFLISIFASLTVIFVYYARRHLMVWRVFAPKFVFDAVWLVTADATLIGSFLWAAVWLGER